MRLPTCIWLVLSLILILPSPAQAREPVEWQTLTIPEFGTTMQIPSSIFAPAGMPDKGVGRRFSGPDPRATLSIYSRPNETDESPTAYLKHNLRMNRSALGYTRVTGSFFAISSERDGVILYSRCNFSRRGRGAIHCFDLTYPQEEKRAWDPVVTRMSLSLRPLER
jgi:hypothetical protein